MKRLSTHEIRQLWLDYFEELGHVPVPSSSLVPSGDPTLLLVNAGMVQFKDLFLGLERRPYVRAATAQKCMRVSGKHNDLENVGPSPRHHTFFEMLGNFSFGDYFKKEAVEFAWNLLVHELEMPLERLWFTVYEDDAEAERLWIETGAAPERVLRFGKKDNWWAMGDTGPCGPCSEIHFYWGDLERQTAAGVNEDDEYLEIWNLVFMQYDQQPGGLLAPLPAPSVDTGAGLERLASILQGTDNNYDTDAFAPILARIQELAEHSAAERRAHLFRYRAIADHSRSCTFLIADGVLPGNEGRSYILRMILRRAARFGKLIGFNRPFLADVAAVVIDAMGEHYTDLRAKRDFILETITAEEERFHRTLNTGLTLLDDLMDRLRSAGQTVIAGGDAFFLWDTYGFPVDLTRDIAEENGFTVDKVGYDTALEQQRAKSRTSVVEKLPPNLAVYAHLLDRLRSEGALGERGVQHLIYDNLDETETTVIGLIVDGQIVQEAHQGTRVEVVLPETPFYVESGGQVSDTGEIYFFPAEMDLPVYTIAVSDARRYVPGLIVHSGEVTSGTVRVGDPANAAIDVERRWDIMRNHTATHVLHAVLRHQLGSHVHQSGSLVAPDRLRFDFTHNAPLRREEITDIERRASEIIRANYDVNTRWTSYRRALEEGATALFSEKYGDEVRVVSFGEEEALSMELCGGTHVNSTAEIGGFYVLNETSSAAGVRRIEVATGRGAETFIGERLDDLAAAAALLHTRPGEVSTAVRGLAEQNSQLQRELAQLRQRLAQQGTASLLDQAVRVDGVAVLAVQVEAADVDTLRQMTDWLRERLGSSVVVVGAVVDDKPMLVAGVTSDLQTRGMHAGNLVRDVAKIIGGGGGGRPNMAQAGGKDAAKLAEALGSVPAWVEQHLN